MILRDRWDYGKHPRRGNADGSGGPGVRDSIGSIGDSHSGIPSFKRLLRPGAHSIGRTPQEGVFPAPLNLQGRIASAAVGENHRQGIETANNCTALQVSLPQLQPTRLGQPGYGLPFDLPGVHNLKDQCYGAHVSRSNSAHLELRL